MLLTIVRVLESKPMSLIWKQKVLCLCVGLTLLGSSGCQRLQTAPRLTPLPRVAAPATLAPYQQATQALINATPTSPPTATPFPIATATENTSQAESLSRLFNPLTGMEASSPSRLTQRPVLVKLANWPQSLRPLVGINPADIVFEYYIGHQMNHLAALYYGSDSQQAGPLAPARNLDLQLAEVYQSNLVIASAPEPLGTTLRRNLAGRVAFRGDLSYPAFYTEPLSLGGNTVVDTTAVRLGLAKQEGLPFVPNLEGMHFDAALPPNGETGIELCYSYADFSVMQWHYNPDTGFYELWQDWQNTAGNYELAPSSDREGTPVRTDNLVVLFGKYLEYSEKEYDYQLVQASPQQALIFRDGQLFYAQWQVPGPLSPIVFTDLNGQPFALKPGRSWIVLSSFNTRTTSLPDGVWELEFSVK